jgi:GT2 family glycosyltransferase
MSSSYYKLKNLKISSHIKKVDIIVLSNNGLETTKDFLNLLYKNTNEKDFRLIWIDNGSTDGTVDFLKTFFENRNNVVAISSEDNLGVVDGRNLGYYYSTCTSIKKSDFLLYLDNDQFVSDGWLEQHFSVLNMGYDIVGVEAWRMNKIFVPTEKIESINKDFNYVGCGGMLIKREVTKKIGMFDTRFNPSYFEDPDFVMRAYDAGFKIGWNYKSKIIHMPHQTLGKLPQDEKMKRFNNSWKEFRKKWDGHSLNYFKQEKIINNDYYGKENN